ncbi:MAG: hypothetical protein H6673_05640 [Anaerolineales bacterium]|nr:hypothetical protein [Anaerolineales bacterium]
MQKTIVFLLLLCLLPNVALAQDGSLELPETFQLDTESGTLSINYPSGWIVGGQGSAFPYGVIDNQPLTGKPLASARVEIAVSPSAALPFSFDPQAENPATAYLEAYQRTRLGAGMGVYGHVVPVTLGNGFTGAFTTFFESDDQLPLVEPTKMSLAMVAAINTETLLILEMQAVQSQDYMGLWYAMLDTLAWDGVALIDRDTKAALEGLDPSAMLRRLFNEFYQDPPLVPGPDPTIHYTMTIDDTVVDFVRPQGWYSVEDDQQITLQNVNMAGASLDFAWVDPVDPDTTPQAIPLATLLATLDARGAEVVDLYSFEWGGYLAAGVTYRIGAAVGMQFGLMIDDGVLQITAESLRQDWMTARGNLIVVVSSLTINEIKVGLDPLLRSINALRNPA